MRKLLTQICRVLVGVLFILSGWIKANDPMGFGYKLAEYFDVFGTTFFVPYAAWIAMAICVFEIFLGVALLAGAFRRFTMWSLLGLMVFFLFLTFYSAYFNKVTDCGCFGDALHLKPWQSFQKDVVLLILILILFFNQRYIQPLGGSERTAEAISYGGVALSLVFTLYCYLYLPVVDFRPYAIGKNIREQMTVPPGAPTDSFDMTFIYHKGDKEFKFKMDELSKIDSTYKYDTTLSVQVREGYKPAIHDFVINSPKGEKMSDKFLEETGYRLMIVQYDLNLSDTRAQKRLNELVDNLIGSYPDLHIWPLTSSSDDLIQRYRTENHVPYLFYLSDGVMLKTIIRSNPGLLLLKGNEVIDMWPGRHLPSADQIAREMR